MMNERVCKIENYLEELYPDAFCELKFNKDYELLLAVVMSAQTTDKRVNQVTDILFKKYDSLEKLKDASISDIENIIKPIGTYHKKAIFIKEIATNLVDLYDSKMPQDRKLLESLPGVGRKTVNVVLSVLYDYPAIAVDTHVERVSKRLGLAYKNDDVYKVEMKLQKKFKRKNWSKRHHQLIFFGRYKCKAQRPECSSCKLLDICKYNSK
ncbi:MAG: endonuclease III [Bacilli bacterium]|nr:endonuclease III [Bacilli bacterium]